MDLQDLAELRIKEARILLDAGSYPGAFYLAGYSVECALKACIAKALANWNAPQNGADYTGETKTHFSARARVCATLLTGFAVTLLGASALGLPERTRTYMSGNPTNRAAGENP